MTEWVVLVPPGDGAIVRVADVDEPTLLHPNQVEGWARLQAARREYERALAAMQMQAPEEAAPRRAGPVAVTRDLPGLDAVPFPDHTTPPAPAPGPDLPMPTEPQPVDVHTDEETGEEHRAFRVPGPRYPCRCNSVFDSPAELERHMRGCKTAKRHRDLDGHAEPGAFKWGVV